MKTGSITYLMIDLKNNVKRIEKHLFLSDLQIPDHDILSIQAVLKFAKDFKPDTLHLVGDILNLTKASSYEQNVYDHTSLADEVCEARLIITQIVKTVRGVNPTCAINFYEGNHENRLLRYLSRNAAQLAELSDDDGYIITMPRLLELKKHNIKWIPYFKHYVEKGNVVVEHGDVARSKSGYTAHAMLDKRGSSGISGHTHRLGMVFRTQGYRESFWIENGCLCKRSMQSAYVKNPDWINGFSYAIYHPESRIMYPVIVPIFQHSFYAEGKVYRG
jgi:hypothetical protein